MKLTRFAKFAWITLAFNILVILWGAFVRATGSGAGCGAHWPLCDGQAIPFNPSVEQMIEFSHRMSSGVALILVAVMLIWAFRAYPKGSIIRKGAVWSSVIIILEALLGAGLVLLGLTADNDSVMRAAVIALHLVNTFLLLAAITCTAWWASGGRPIDLHGKGPQITHLSLGLVGLIILGSTGAITALGDTLFPSTSLVEGIRQDMDEAAHFLIQLRVIHPIIAICESFYILWLAKTYGQRYATELTGKIAWALGGTFIIELCLGAINVVLLAPVWMQLVHLFVADTLWILLVLLSASVLQSAPEKRTKTATQTVSNPA
jgi:heme A synthase